MHLSPPGTTTAFSWIFLIPTAEGIEMKILSPTKLYVILVGTFGFTFGSTGFVVGPGDWTLPLVAIIEAVSILIITSVH